MTEAQAVVLLLAMFGIKHFIVDFLIQTPYQFLNKGTYLHPGGLLHSGLHSLGTILVLWIFADWYWILIMAIFDFIVHYHTDWIKVKINKKFGWTTENSKFWWLFGLDQLIHWLTYTVIIGWTIGAF